MSIMKTTNFGFVLLFAMCVSAASAQAPRLDPPVATHDNATEPVFTLAAYTDRLVADIARARKSIHMDCYTMGGKYGERIAKALIARKREGLDVRVLLDRHLGTVGSLKSECKVVLAMLQDGGVAVRFGATRKGSGIRRRVVDHCKLAVLDGAVTYVGGTNIADIFEKYNDLMIRVDGPTAAVVDRQFEHDWFVAGNPDAPLPRDVEFTGAGQLENRSKPGLATIRVVGTGPGRVTFHGALLNEIRSAKRSIEVQLHQLNHDPVIDELIAAARRGVAVRVMLDPTDIENFIPMMTDGPRGMWNANAVMRLREGNVPVKFVALEGVFDAYHMKLGLFDGTVLLVGSPNWDRRGSQVLTETALEIAGGPAVAAVRTWFEGNWEKTPEQAEVGYFARLVSFLLKNFV
jgi:cardiolipin synthase